MSAAAGGGSRHASVAIVGGGLAGLATAAALCGRGLSITLFEARSRLGGRAGSFRDPTNGQLIDHCQHVGMTCCTNLIDFCHRTDIAHLFRRDKVLHFVGPDGRRFDLMAAWWLPAPLHLAPALLRLGYLSWRERFGIARSLRQLARQRNDDSGDCATIGDWLQQHGQSPRAIERFWSVVLVSALGETVEHASLAAARKVFVDGFLAARRAYEVHIPIVPLRELYGDRLTRWLTDRDVRLCLAAAVAQIEGTASGITAVLLADGTRQPFDFVVVALPWHCVRGVFPDELAAALPQVQTADRLEAAPITGVHLWFDRPIPPLPHAVLIDRLAQWVFNRGQQSDTASAVPAGHYYQVVISASRQLSARGREDVIREVCGDLSSAWPRAREAKLLHWRMVTERNAVFSPRTGGRDLRPDQETRIPNLMLAGDWTKTGWPSTMESAVRSGYLAAEAVLRANGQSHDIIVPDLPASRLSKLLGFAPRADR